MEGFLVWTPNLLEIPFQLLSLKSLAFETPSPLEFEMTFLGGGGGGVWIFFWNRTLEDYKKASLDPPPPPGAVNRQRRS